MKDCTCTDAGGAECRCADAEQRPVGEGPWRPDSVTLDAAQEGQCHCQCESDGNEGWRDLDDEDDSAEVEASVGEGVGMAAAFVGDVDGDGRTDTLLGASRHNANTGRAYILLGHREITAGDGLRVDALDGSAALVLSGAASQDRLGVSVAAAGDVNGDGFADVIVGADGHDGGSAAAPLSNSGAAYVMFGGPSLPADLPVAEMGSTQGFKLVGSSANALLGTSVGGAGDFNGDGIDDVIVGAPGEQRAYVVFGRQGGGFGRVVHVGNMTCEEGVVLEETTPNSAAGQAVAMLGDFNGDGRADLAVGAPTGGFDSRPDQGFAYVVLGAVPSCAAGEAAQRISLPDDITSGAAAGLVLEGYDSQGHLGFSVSGSGDVDGDGLQDLVVGAHLTAGGGVEGSGEAYVLYGVQTPAAGPFNVGDLYNAGNAAIGFVVRGAEVGEWAGYAVGGGSDVNSDGLADVLVGAIKAREAAGALYVIYGNRQRGGVVELATAREETVARFTGPRSGGEAGTAVGGGGDVNGDGHGDVVVGIPANMEGGAATIPAAAIVFGRNFSADVWLEYPRDPQPTTTTTSAPPTTSTTTTPAPTTSSSSTTPAPTTSSSTTTTPSPTTSSTTTTTPAPTTSSSTSTTPAPTSSSSSTTPAPTTSSSTTTTPAPTTSSTTPAPTTSGPTPPDTTLRGTTQDPPTTSCTSTTPAPTTSSSTTTSPAPTTSSTTTSPPPTTSSTTTTPVPTTSSSTTTTPAPTTSSSTTTTPAPTTSSSTTTTPAPTTSSSSSTPAPTTTTVPPTTPSAEEVAEVCARGAGGECLPVLHPDCSAWRDQGHLWSLDEQQVALAACMRADCQQSLEGPSTDLPGCRFVDENSLCFSAGSAQFYCRDNSPDLCNDAGPDWAQPPLGTASSSPPGWLPSIFPFLGSAAGQGQFECACMQNCVCDSAGECRCTDRNQEPVGPGGFAPSRVQRDNTQGGMCYCSCERVESACTPDPDQYCQEQCTAYYTDNNRRRLDGWETEEGEEGVGGRRELQQSCQEDADLYCVEQCIDHNPAKPCGTAFCNNGGQCSKSPSSCSQCPPCVGVDPDQYCLEACQAFRGGGRCNNAFCNNGGRCSQSPESCDNLGGDCDTTYVADTCAAAACSASGQCSASPHSCCQS